jgi:hypothetical protein
MFDIRTSTDTDNGPNSSALIHRPVDEFRAQDESILMKGTTYT